MSNTEQPESSFKGQSFTDLVAPYPKPKREYLYFILMGKGIGEALRLVNRDPNLVNVWRADDLYFKELEAYLRENIEVYREQAYSSYISELATYADEFISDLLVYYHEHKLEEIPTRLLPYIWKASERVRPTKPGEPESYDEIILKRRRKV